MNLAKKRELAQKRKWRIRKKIIGSWTRPRVTICFSNRNVHAQCIDDEKGHTLASISTNNSNFKTLLPNVKGAQEIGDGFADILSKENISTIVFDRAGRKYHGCVKAFAEALRSKNIKF